MGLFDFFTGGSSPEKKPEETAPPPTQAAGGGAPPPGGDGGGEGSEGWMNWLSSGLSRTAQWFNTDIRDLFKAEGRMVDEEFLNELFAVLIRTDMGAGPARQIRDRIATDYRARIVHMIDIQGVIKSEFKSLLAQAPETLRFTASGPTVVMVVGVNGSGKTTSIAKLTKLLTSQGKKVVLGAADTFRAAAVSQLTIWAERLGVEIVRGEQGGDPAAVAHRAVAKSLEIQADVCIVDTAGRLQTQVNLMQELEKIKRVMSKLIPGAPHEVLLVLDATAGQNGISQAKGFSQAVQCTGIFLAKLDGSAKGGVVIPIRQQFQLPVKFIGLGERPEDVALFDPEPFVEALFTDPRTIAARSSV